MGIYHYCGCCPKVCSSTRKVYLNFLVVNFELSSYFIRRVVRLGASHRRLSMSCASLSACAIPPHELLDCTSKQPTTTKGLTTRPPIQEGFFCCGQTLELRLPYRDRVNLRQGIAKDRSGSNPEAGSPCLMSAMNRQPAVQAEFGAGCLLPSAFLPEASRPRCAIKTGSKESCPICCRCFDWMPAPFVSPRRA